MLGKSQGLSGPAAVQKVGPPLDVVAQELGERFWHVGRLLAEQDARPLGLLVDDADLEVTTLTSGWA